jgi:hypothetical protein
MAYRLSSEECTVFERKRVYSCNCEHCKYYGGVEARDLISGVVEIECHYGEVE